MNETVMRIISRMAVFAAAALAAGAAAAQAPPRNPVCNRLEAQLQQLERGGQNDPQRAEQIRRYEDVAQRQQAELDKLSLQARRLGCEGRGFFSLFGGQPQQCGPLNSQIQQVRATLDRTLADLQRLQGNSSEREGERRAILASLGQNDCGPQYRQFVNRGPGSFLESLFGGGTVITPEPPPGASPAGDTYRTLCVRTCDGYYFPVSYSTTPAGFAQDEQVCRRLCPAAEVALFSHRNPGEDVAQAVSTGGRTYSELPNAFAFRKAFNPSCSCRAPGQSWAEVLKEDNTIENGDIIVTEEQAKLLSQPADTRAKAAPAAKGKGAQPKGAQPKGAQPKDAQPKGPASPPAQTTPKAEAAKPAVGKDGKRQVRTVGPPFLPAN